MRILLAVLLIAVLSCGKSSEDKSGIQDLLERTRNPWFAEDLLPELRQRVAALL